MIARTARLVRHQTRFDLLALARNPRARFFTLLFPILLLVIFNSVFGSFTTVTDGVRVSSDRFYVPGIITMAVITSCYVALTQRVVTQRAAGILKRRRATPVPGWVLVAGQVGAAASLVAVAVAVIVGSACFCALGYAVSTLVDNPDAAQPIVQFTLFPLYFISGVWVPTDSLPDGIRAVGEVFPVAHLADALHTAFAHGSLAGAFAPADLAVLAAWGAAGLALAAWRFDWLPEGATA
jgi:ABC-2 type transport system permease protein